jgi:cytosine/adenosine deaminase-related metal-dependent hydrolase
VLITADWVLPIDREPIRFGAVRVEADRIAAVATVTELAAGDGERVDLPGCALLPGLVNGHTHLALTALHGRVPSAAFPDWLTGIVPLMASLDEDARERYAAAGALECLRGGVTVVGDISYGAGVSHAVASLGLGGVCYFEVLGIAAASLPATLAENGFPAAFPSSARVRPGLSPHAPYTVGPELMRAIAGLARERSLPFAVHVAESRAETQLLAGGSGPLAFAAETLAVGFTAPRTSSVAYLAGLGALDGALAIHCIELDRGDAETLAERTRGVVLCPRSNAYLHNDPPPVTDLVAAGATIAVGTDSSASNASLDLFAEARALAALAPSLPAERLLRIMTLEGATALGAEEAFGSLTPGKQADLVALRVDGGSHPVEAVLAMGSPERVDVHPEIPI